MINKDTKLFGSFAETAGSKGCKYFNAAFQFCDVNAIYKSFSVNSIEAAVAAANTLNMSGFAVTMPFKTEVIQYLDFVTDDVKEIGACNTVIRHADGLKGYNTDANAAFQKLRPYLVTHSDITILGNGGYSKAVQHACKKLGMNVTLITRQNWDRIVYLTDELVFNCTPVKFMGVQFHGCTFIDCDVESTTGKQLGMLQAAEQFYLYTRLEFPFK